MTTINATEKKLTKAEIKAQADLIAMREALTTRINYNEAFQASKDLEIVRKAIFAENFVTVLANCNKAKLDYSRIITCIAVCEKGDDFIANKVLVKIIQLLQAVAGNAQKLDGYTKAVLFNLANGVNSMTVFEIQQAISRAVVNDNNVHKLSLQERSIKNVKNSSIGTAGSQSSSSRMCLWYLNIAETVKGQKDAPLDILTESNNGKAFVALAEKLFKRNDA